VSWSGKNVLVTGAGGFIGSHLAERMVQEGARVRALVHYNALGSCGWLDTSPLVREMEVIAGDVRDRDRVVDAVQGVQTIFHLAALIAIPYSYHAPLSYVQTNVEGTLNILQAARQAGVGRVIHTSTSEVYGTAQYAPIDERHPLVGQSPYAASKIGADQMAQAFHLSFGLPVVTVRPFNTFGPRQSPRAVIPAIITQLLAGETLRLGSLSPRRDLNFVSNTVDGFLAAAQAGDQAQGKVFNFGSGREISIGDLAQLIAEQMGRSLHIETEAARLRPDGSEVERLLADHRLAQSVLGWSPTVSLEDGLLRTIEWFTARPELSRSSSFQL
jgi:dTDP-glucose 4,6-dehydratase